MRITEVLNNIKKNLPTIFIIRHAERFYKESPEHDFFCYLTEQGKVHSRELGQHIKNSIGSITKVRSSIVERYVETGNEIIKGNGNNIILSKVEYLTKPYIIEPQTAMVEFPQYSTKQLVKMHLAGEMISCMRDKIEGTQMFLSPVLKDLLMPNNKSVYVTHDYLLGMLFGINYDIKG